MNDVTTKHFTAHDGIPIAYHVLGNGSPIVIVHGSVSRAQDWMQVAHQLADRHTCYVLDRRGRGASGDAEAYTLDTEARDITALLEIAGPEATLLGHSYGAICTLETVRNGARPRQLALYEAPLPYAGPTAGEHLVPFTEAVERGENEQAMLIACDHFLRIPREETEALRGSPLWPQLVELVPTWPRELREIDLTVDRLDAYAALDLPVLLLVGERSPWHLRGATDWLSDRMKDATVAPLAGQGHFANALDPQAVASAVDGFTQS